MLLRTHVIPTEINKNYSPLFSYREKRIMFRLDRKYYNVIHFTPLLRVMRQSSNSLLLSIDDFERILD